MAEQVKGGVTAMSTLSLSEVKAVVKELLKRYHAEYALLFGSYARGDATPDSDIDIIIVGGKDFVPRNIFALAEDLREMTGRNADVFEMREVNTGTPFYESVMKEGIRIA
jgi:predicted nucleotidyltransferase